MTATARRKTWTAVLLIVTVLALLYGARVIWLFMGATEGDIPAASALPLPAGTEVLTETHDCGSGGCWAVYSIRPPAGQSPEELADAMGASPQMAIRGHIVDPRTIWVWAEPGDDELTLRADYFSQTWTP